MKSVHFEILPPPEVLKKDVQCFSVVEYTGNTALAIRVSPQAVPGIVFQHQNGRTAIESIMRNSGITAPAPTLFLYAAGTEPSIMNFARGSYLSIQVILKPHALNSLLGINASKLSAGFVELDEFSSDNLNEQLLNAPDKQTQIHLLNAFLMTQFQKAKTRDSLIEESLQLIHKNIAAVTIKQVLEYLNISERQFERRFHRTVGVSPQAYIRVKRFNEAVRLIKTGQYKRLTDIAHALNFYDQSHLIRDIKAFSGLSPKNLTNQDNDFYNNQTGYSFI